MMGGQKPQLGFTIVETLIVLAVSGAIFLSAAILVQGRINKTQFSQAIQDIQSRTQQSINQVINGFYPNNNQISCTQSAGGPVITQVSNTAQGTNKGCIFIGKAMQFAIHGSPSQFNIYTIAALRQTASLTEVSTFSQAIPTLIAKGRTRHRNVPNVFDQQNLENGLTVVSMYYNDNPSLQIGAVAFISSLADFSASNNQLLSGSQQVDLYAIPGTSLNSPGDVQVDAIDSQLSLLPQPTITQSVEVCFKSAGTPQYALMSIGSASSSQLTVTITVKSTVNCA